MSDYKSCAVTNKDELEETKPNLKFKLKLPTKFDQGKDLASINSASTKDDKEEQEEETAEVVKLQVSPFCNKGFVSSSVEALASENNNNSEEIKKSNKKRKVNAVANVALTTTAVDGSSENQNGVMTSSFNKCPLPDCGKEYRSKQSLYGHMRSHSNRPWRGMTPPSETALEMASMRFGTWRVTGKRGREGRVTYSSSAGYSESQSGSESESDTAEVANILLLLASGDERDNNDYNVEDYEVKRAKKGKGLMIPNNNNNNNEEEVYDLIKNLRNFPNYKVNHDDYNDGEEVIKLKHDDYDDDDDDDEVEDAMKVNSPIIGMKISKKIGKINNPKEKERVCNICGKTFSNPQALGGHKSSHTKNNNNSNSNSNSNNPGMGQIRIVDGSGSSNPRPVKPLVAEHKCEVCGRTFDKGQSLGGHKRCHYVVPSTDVSSSSPGQSSSQTGRVGVMGRIDLNLDPSMYEDEGDDDYITPDYSRDNKYYS